jgi:hypothetical protein
MVSNLHPAEYEGHCVYTHQSHENFILQTFWDCVKAWNTRRQLISEVFQNITCSYFALFHQPCTYHVTLQLLNVLAVQLKIISPSIHCFHFLHFPEALKNPLILLKCYMRLSFFLCRIMVSSCSVPVVISGITIIYQCKIPSLCLYKK